MKTLILALSILLLCSAQSFAGGKYETYADINFALNTVMQVQSIANNFLYGGYHYQQQPVVVYPAPPPVYYAPPPVVYAPPPPQYYYYGGPRGYGNRGYGHRGGYRYSVPMPYHPHYGRHYRSEGFN